MKKFILLLAIWGLMSNTMCVHAEEKLSIVEIPEEIEVNQETGEFAFDIELHANEKFAGLEVGLICGDGCEISDTSYNVEASEIEPTAAQGVTWFGFFDGEDSFIGDVVITIEGTCEEGKDSAISIQDIKKCTVGNEEFKQEYISVNEVIALKNGQSEQKKMENNVFQGGETQVVIPAEQQGISVVGPITIGVLLVGIVIALIYRSRKKAIQKEEKSE